MNGKKENNRLILKRLCNVNVKVNSDDACLQEFDDLRQPVKRWAKDNSVSLSEADYRAAERIFQQLGVVPSVHVVVV